VIVTLHLVISEKWNISVDASTISARRFAGRYFAEQALLFRFPSIRSDIYSLYRCYVFALANVACISSDCTIVVFIYIWNVTRTSLCIILRVTFHSRRNWWCTGSPGTLKLHFSESIIYIIIKIAPILLKDSQLYPRHYKTYIYLWNDTLPANFATYIFLHYIIMILDLFLISRPLH